MTATTATAYLIVGATVSLLLVSRNEAVRALPIEYLLAGYGAFALAWPLIVIAFAVAKWRNRHGR